MTGHPDAATDYDKLKPVKTIPLAEIGGVNPEPYPKEGVAVLRGQLPMPATGVYEFRPGYGASEENIMIVDGTEVYRKEPGGKAVQTAIKLEAGKKVPFKVTYLNQPGQCPRLVFAHGHSRNPQVGGRIRRQVQIPRQ